MAKHAEEDHERWRQQRSQEQLALGGLPLNAEWRLRGLQNNRRLFTTGMGVGALALNLAHGIRPLGQVTGTSIYHVGWQPTPLYGSLELVTLTEAHNAARRLALRRLQMEAQQIGAHAVVGVRALPKPELWGTAALEVSWEGTAVSIANAPKRREPVISALSGTEFWALYRAGYLPSGLVWGSCVYHQMGALATQWAGQSPLVGGTGRIPQELSDYTGGFQVARHSAVARLWDAAAALSAEGVIGVRIEKQIEVHESEVEQDAGTEKRKNLIIRFTAVGTAIQPFQASQPVITYTASLR